MPERNLEELIHVRPIGINQEMIDPVAIAKARAELLALDTEGKLFISPNHKTSVEPELLRQELFVPREELGGRSIYDYFDRIIFGHGEGPEEVDQRKFKNADEMSPEYEGTVGQIKERITKPGEKVLVAVCGTDKKHKITISRTLDDYLKKHPIEK